MSYEQAVAAVRGTANYLFGRKEFGECKSFDPNVPVDNNTLPKRKNVLKNPKLFEAMTSNLLVEDVMKGNKAETCVVYSFDGSAMSGLGNCVVQSFTVNGVHRSLPTFGVF